MRTITVVGRKGGSGKSTIASQLAINLWRRGARIVLADADPQNSAIDIFRARTQPGPKVIQTSAAKLFALQTTLRRESCDILVIDTPVAESDVAQAIGRADLAVMVLRPTYVDLAAAVNTSRIIHQLQKPGFIVVNQAPVPRPGTEAPIVRRTFEALRLLDVPVADSVIRARPVYQRAVANGQSAEEAEPSSAASRELRALFTTIYDGLMALPDHSERQFG